MTKLSITLVTILAATAIGCSSSLPEVQAVEDAAEAMGGADAIREVTALTVEGSGTRYRLGQNRSPDSDLPESQVQSFTRRYDLTDHQLRTEIVSANFLGNMVTQVAALDGDVAFSLGGEGEAQREGAAARQELQAEYYHHPLPLLQAALTEDEGMRATASNLREESGRRVVDVSTTDGVRLALHVDAQTNLPAMITSTQYNTNLGDVTLSTTFGDWAEVGGVQLPQMITQTIDAYPAAELKVSNTLNGAVGNLAAPAEVASAPEPAPPSANVTTEEIAPGVWYLAGQSHHSVLVEFGEYAALVEAPQNDTRTLAVIARARDLVPDKPLRYLVNTHHHFDHSGGLRAAVAEGLTIITHEINRSLYERLVEREHSVVRDRLAENSMPLMLETVTGDEKFELRSGNRVMEIYRIQGDTHNDGILMVYLPRERILIEADVYTPGRPGGPGVANLLKNIKGRGLRARRIAPIHGQVVSFAEFEKTAMAAPAATE